VGAIERIRAERLVAVLRRVADVDAVVDVLAGAGVGVVEVTMDDSGAAAAIERLRARGDVAVLAGTVRTAHDVDDAAAAGAEACVSPSFSDAVVTRCRELGLPAIPGALTPTEVEAAWRAGVALVKLFPGSLGGPRYVRELLAPLGDVPLLVTGGISADNAAEYLHAGAAAVGAGSSLSGASDVAAEARRLVAAVRNA
jgi:2-dehydro-3-deoxyphosphogluconate aldolase/(4S)-4-hydroxy-2-oxoglutarate aldolase